jgi:peptidyl-Asp metalloendopeptidase
LAGFTVQFVTNHPSNGWSIAGAGDIDGDGRADLFWSNRNLQQADWWLMNGPAWTYGGSMFVPSQYRVAGIGDTDGDNRVDIVWEDASQIWLWHREAAGSFTPQLVGSYPPAGWTISH